MMSASLIRHMDVIVEQATTCGATTGVCMCMGKHSLAVQTLVFAVAWAWASILLRWPLEQGRYYVWITRGKMNAPNAAISV